MASPAWQRRNAAARNLGYKSYYDYRVHDYGRRPPSAAVLASTRPALRGHRSAADLGRSIDQGALVTYNGSERDPTTGRFLWVELAVVDAHGNERVYRLSGKQLERKNLQKLVNAMVDAGAILAPVRAYLDLAQYASDTGADTDG